MQFASVGRLRNSFRLNGLADTRICKESHCLPQWSAETAWQKNALRASLVKNWVPRCASAVVDFAYFFPIFLYNTYVH